MGEVWSLLDFAENGGIEMSRGVLTILTVFGLLLTDSPLTAVEKQGEVVLAEPRPDRALVYFLRPSSVVGAARTLFLYSDDQFLGSLNKGNYTFAYVEPGVHLFWTNWTRITREIDVAPGQVYYLNVWPRKGMSGNFDILPEEDGLFWINKIKTYVAPGKKEQTKSKQHLANRLGKAEEREAMKPKAEVVEVATPATPLKTEGMALIPAGTEIRVELLGTVSSRFNQPGDPVWLANGVDRLKSRRSNTAGS